MAACEEDMNTSKASSEGRQDVNDNQLISSGWLSKKGHTNTAWKRRYFILRGDELEYYTHEPCELMSKFRGSILLTNILVYNITENSTSRTNEMECGFVLQTRSDDGTIKAIYLKAQTKQSRDAWLQQLSTFSLKVDCVGWLEKKSQYITQTWKREWFVLELPAELHHFSSPGGKWKGSFDLTGAHVEPVSGKQFEIEIHLWKEDKRIVVRVNSSDDLLKWKTQCQRAAVLEFKGFDQVSIKKYI